jgi:hypothetical protein
LEAQKWVAVADLAVEAASLARLARPANLAARLASRAVVAGCKCAVSNNLAI